MNESDTKKPDDGNTGGLTIGTGDRSIHLVRKIVNGVSLYTEGGF